MVTIYKYILSSAERQTLSLPNGAEILTARAQGNAVYLWAKVNVDAPSFDRTFLVYGTGHSIPEDIYMRYIDTVFIMGLVFHVFELIGEGY